MKKLISLILAVALVLSLCTLAAFAGETKTNIALEKDVETWDGGGANADFRLPEWFQKENLVDGKLDAFDGNASNLNQSLSWYVQANMRDVDVTATVDLDGTYNIGEVKLFPTKFLDGAPTPCEYTVEISEDGSDWTVIGQESLPDGGVYSDPFIYDGEGQSASYIRIYITKTSNITDGTWYAGFGELEVYEGEPAHTGEKRDFDAAKGDGLSYDWILANGTEIANGNAAVIAAKKNIDGTDGSIENITLYGWYGNANSATAALGYQINGGTISYGDYFTTTEDAVTNLNANNRRFYMTIDVSELTGENTIWVWAKLENGDEVKLNRFDNKGTEKEKDREIYVIYNGPAAPAAYTLAGVSFDTFFVDGVMNFGQGDGMASSKLDGVNRTVDGSDGSIETIVMRGWVGFDKAIAQFGYQVGDQEPVFDDSFKKTTEQAVLDAGGANASRFEVEIPVGRISGTNVITTVVKLVDGTVVKLDSQFAASAQGLPDVSFTYVGTQSTPATADASMIIFVIAAAAIALVVLKKKVF